MNPARFSSTFIIFLVLIFQISCSKGHLTEESTRFPFSISSRDVIDYTASLVTVNIKGSILEGSVASSEKVQFFSDSTCKGDVLGESIVSEFDEVGANVELPINQTVQLYISSPSSSECLYIEDYTHPSLAPGVPVLSNVEPTSPSRTITSPGLFGTAFPSSSTVEFYSDNLCATVLSQGPTSDFGVSGIIVPLSANTVSTIYSRTKDELGNYSVCQMMTQYEHSDAMSLPPQLTNISHVSPNKESFTPTLRGITSVGTVSVALYSDPGCLQELATGTPEDFLSPGFQITSTPDSTIAIYGQSIDDLDQPSVCAFLTTYTHDGVAPGPPTYIAASPISPTNQTTTPSITGSSSADTATVGLYNSNTCQNIIGSGTKSEFETTGVVVGLPSNETSEVYAKSFDAAGNDSNCVLMTSYTHNTIPPGAPLFLSSDPTSPTNQSVTPNIIGQATDRTLAINMFKDENCALPIGQGTVSEYEGAGIQVTVDANTATLIFVTVSDFEGNVSDCTFHASYDHSVAPASPPGFMMAFPASPTNATSNPTILGTADNSIESVVLYDDNSCTNSLGSGNRGQFVSSGINISLSPNSTTDIHGVSTDIYGNTSGCTFITQYVHNTVAPFDPTYTAASPVSPNNQSFTPDITGGVLVNPASQLPPSTVSFFDSASCVSKVGEGTPAEFTGVGISLNLPPNAVSSIYGRSYDDAGNFSNCTYLTDYTHNGLIPAAPIFLSTLPASPSYTEDTILSGAFGSSSDFMNRVSFNVYDDAGCTNLVTTDSPTSFETTGIPITSGSNTATSWYGESVNEVGTPSPCTFLTTYTHHDSPIQNLNVILNSNGSTYLTWNPDTGASPTPLYSLERSVQSGGPFSIIATGLISNTYTDLQISNDQEYFYRVFATNDTGRGQNSSEVSILVNAPSAIDPVSLNTVAEDSQITLSWGGFPQNMIYKVFRSTSYGGPYVDLGFETTNISYVDSGLTNLQEYYYIVKASNPSGLSMQSNIASAVPRLVPVAPTELQLVPQQSMSACAGASGAQLAWTASSYYTEFQVYRSQDKFSLNPDVTTAGTSLDRCNLVFADMHYFAVGARWGGGISAGTSNVIGLYTRNATNIAIYPGDGEIILDWVPAIVPTSPVDLSAFTARYDVFSSDDYNGEYTVLAGNLTNSIYTDTVTNGVSKFYYVQAYVIDGGGDKVYLSYPTQVISGTASVSPAAPTNLSLIPFPDESRVQLSWSAPSHYNGFLVYHATAPGGPFTEISYETGPVDFSVPLTEGMNYFRVSTAWGSFESAFSNTVSYRDADISNLAITTSATSLTLDWDAISGVQDYVVFRATNLNGPYTSLGVAATETYEDTTAAAGTGYYYKVNARFADFTEGQLSSAVSGMRTGTETPSNVSLTLLTTSSVRADWPHVDGVTNYRIYRSLNVGGPFELRGTTIQNNFNVTGLMPQTEYFIKVRARVSGIDYDSPVVSILTYGVPSPPTATLGDGQIDLSWASQVGATNYDILKSTDGITFTNLITNYAGTSYLDSSVTNGNIYFYKVVANYPGIQRTSTISLGFTPGTAPLDPTGLSAENDGTGSSIVLTWGRVSGITRYNIYQSTTSGSYGSPVRSSSTSHGTTMTGLTSGTTYYFRVTAVNGTQESGVSNEVAITPGLEPVSPIAVFSNSSSFDISWPVLAGAADYDLQRSIDGASFATIASSIVGTTYNDSTVDPNLTYYYRYQGRTASGVEMPKSGMSSGVNLSIEPQVPLGFQVESNSTAEALISWVKVESVFGYEILRSATSGSGYTVIGTATSFDTSFLDTTVTPGTTYFYVMRSLSLSRVPSPYSVEKSVNLIAGPSTLTAANASSTVDLTWGAVAGAVSYNIRRSPTMGGPYGLIGTSAVLSYSDSDVVTNQNYYYVVEAVFADGSVSLQSNEEFINRSGSLNLQVVIDLTNTGMSSLSSSSLTFKRTETSFDTDYYDGVTGYEVEVIASNTDSVSRNISLVDSGNVVVGTLTVPSGTAALTRFVASVTPNVGSDEYRVRLDQTTSDGDVSVTSTKLLVNQVNATKTRLYFPLLSGDHLPLSQDVEVAVHSTSSESYDDYSYSYLFERAVSKLSKIVDYNAWELEALVSTTGSAEGSFVFTNKTSGQAVNTTETRFVGTSVQMAKVPFDEGEIEFDSSNENDQYQFDLKCEYYCSTGLVKVHKAGIWVELENLSKARIVNKLNSYRDLINSQTDVVEERVYVDTSLYSSSKFYYQALIEDDSFSDGNIELFSHNQDFGGVGLSSVSGSSLFVDSDSVQLYNSPEITPPTGNNVLTRVTPSTGDLLLRGSALIIDVE